MHIFNNEKLRLLQYCTALFIFIISPPAKLILSILKHLSTPAAMISRIQWANSAFKIGNRHGFIQGEK